MNSRFMPYTLGGLIVFGIITTLSIFTTDYVERGLSISASEKFNTWAFREISYTVTGDVITLTGQLNDQNLIEHAEHVAKEIDGVRTVHNLLTAKPSPEQTLNDMVDTNGHTTQEVEFTLKKRHNTFYLAGFVRSNAQKIQIKKRLSDYTVFEQLKVKPLPKRWKNKPIHLIQIAKKFERMTFKMKGQNIHVYGAIKLGERVDLIEANIKRLFPNATITSDLEFEGLGVNSVECQERIDPVLAEKNTIFVSNTDIIKNEEVLNTLAKTMLSCPMVSFQVISPATNNSAINFQRANRVKNFLVGQGVNAELLSLTDRSRAHLHELTPPPQLIINVN